MGVHAAIKYAQSGASKLILAVRSKEKGDAAKASILKKTSGPVDIVVMTVDPTEFASVAAFTRRVNQGIDELHVVLLCASIMIPKFSFGPEGYGINLQVDVLSTVPHGASLAPQNSGYGGPIRA